MKYFKLDNSSGHDIDLQDASNSSIFDVELVSKTIQKIIELLDSILAIDPDKTRAEKVKTDVLDAISCYQEIIDNHKEQIIFIHVISPDNALTNKVKNEVARISKDITNDDAKKENVLANNETGQCIKKENKENSIVVYFEDNSDSKERQMIKLKQAMFLLQKWKVDTQSQVVNNDSNEDIQSQFINTDFDLIDDALSQVINTNLNDDTQSQFINTNIDLDDDTLSQVINSDIDSDTQLQFTNTDSDLDDDTQSQVINTNINNETHSETFTDTKLSCKNKSQVKKNKFGDKKKQLAKHSVLQNKIQSQVKNNKMESHLGNDRLVQNALSKTCKSKLQNSNTPLVRHSCHECDLSFTNPIYLNTHWKRCKGRRIRTWGDKPDTLLNQDGKLTCNICSSTFSTKYNLKKHMINHKLFQLQNDTKKMNTLISIRKDPSNDEYNELEEMLNEQSNGSETTANTNKNYESSDPIKFSVARVLTDVPASEEILEGRLQCTECDRAYKTRDALVFHEQYVHKDKGYSIVCNLCPMTFKTPHYLVKHVRDNHNVTMSEGRNYYLATVNELKKYKYPKEIDLRVFMCKICLRIFPTPKQLKMHKHKSTTRESIPQPKVHENFKKVDGKFICNICSKVYRSYGGIYCHLVDHSGLKSYECDICSKRMATKPSLYIHIQHHYNPRKYVCEECGQEFTNIRNRDRHRKWHIGHKPFKCEVCGKVFQFPYLKKVHMRTHTGEKPYICDMCPQKFGDRRGFLGHINKHKGIKPYKCDQCDKSFLLKRHLNTHKLEHTDCRSMFC